MNIIHILSIAGPTYDGVVGTRVIRHLGRFALAQLLEVDTTVVANREAGVAAYPSCQLHASTIKCDTMYY